MTIQEHLKVFSPISQGVRLSSLICRPAKNNFMESQSSDNEPQSDELLEKTRGSLSPRGGSLFFQEKEEAKLVGLE